jgi:hypothetical protein
LNYRDFFRTEVDAFRKAKVDHHAALWRQPWGVNGMMRIV